MGPIPNGHMTPFLHLPCLLVNNKNLSGQMKVNPETSKIFWALCHKDTLQAAGHLLYHIALYFLPHTAFVVELQIPYAKE